MLKFAQFRMALLVDCAMLTVVPLKVALAAPYCTNDCADVPQLPARQGVGSGGGFAAAMAANSAGNPAAARAQAGRSVLAVAREPDTSRLRFALFSAIAH